MGPEKIQIAPFSAKAELGATPAQKFQTEKDGGPRGSVFDREGNRRDFFVKGLAESEKAMIEDLLGKPGETRVNVSFSGLEKQDSQGELPVDDAPVKTETGGGSEGVVNLEDAKKVRNEKRLPRRQRMENMALAAGMSTLLLITGVQEARAEGFWDTVKDTAIKSGGAVLNTEVNRAVGHGKAEVDARARSATESITTGRNLANTAINYGTNKSRTERAYETRMMQIEADIDSGRRYNLELEQLYKTGQISKDQYEQNYGRKGMNPLEAAAARDEARRRFAGTALDQERSFKDNFDQVAASGARAQVGVAASSAQRDVRVDATAAGKHWDTAGAGMKSVIDGGVRAASERWTK